MAKNTKQISIDNTAFDFRPKGICSTIANNASKTVSITDFTLFDGATVLVKFENNNTAPYPTLNINDTGAKSIIGGNLTSGGIYEFMYDGTYWNIIKSDSSKNYHVIDLTSLSQDNFYPVIFNAKHYVNDCEIHSPNVAGTSAYNQNILHFQLHACGYSDTPKSFKVLSYGTYSNLKITIGAVGYGHTTGEHCVWVRGGMKYEFICNIKPMLYADGYSNNEQIFMPGINYYGGENVKVTYCWSADNPRSEVLSEAATNTKLGGIKTGYTQSGKNYPVQLDSNNKAYVNVSWTDNDTKNTAGSTNNSSKLYLIGATEQSANPQTYSNSKVYATDGVLTATTFSGTATNADKLGGQLPAYYATAADYVKKSGDTITGYLTIKNNSSGAPSIVLQQGETNDTYEDWRMSNVGGYFKIQNENSGNTWIDVLSLTPSATKTLTSSYSVLPSTNDTLTLGNSTYKWKDVYATNFLGKATTASYLDGNAATSVNSCYGNKILKYYTLSGCTATEATGNKRYAGTDDSYGFPVSNNANGLLWLGNHSTNYGHQLGFSSDGNIYHRKIDNGSFPTTVNGGSWKQILAGAASSTNLGGIKIGYTSVGNTYPVQLNSKSQAYVTVPAATDAALGVIKLAAAPRTTTITTKQGGTTSNRYYGVEVDLNGKAFVNVPWTNNTDTKVKQTAKTDNVEYPVLLGKNSGTSGTAYESYYDSGITINPSTNVLKGAKTYESLLQWGNINISGSLSPLDVGMDGQWSANRLSYMPASDIQVEYSTDSGSTWTDYGLTDNQKRSFVTTGLSYPLYPGKNTTRQKINTDRVRVTITASNNVTYFSLKKIYMYISQNGASGCKVIVEKSQCGSDTTFVQVGEYAISGWSGWNSIPLTNSFGGGDNQTSNIRRLRFTYYFTTYSTGYGETDDTSGVIWFISKLNMIGETYWSNSGGSLATTGHIYSYDIDKNTTFPAIVNATEFKENNVSLANKYNQKTSVINVTADTISSLEPNSMYVISNRTVTANNITAPSVNSITTYSIFVVSGIIKFGSNISIYWADGSKPPTSTIGNYEVVITGVRTSNSIIYSATWAKYTIA